MPHNETVNATIIEVRVGRDGKRYPIGWKLPEEDRQRAIAAEHHLAHAGMSVRRIQQALLEAFELRRSIGAIHRDLRLFTCKECDHG